MGNRQAAWILAWAAVAAIAGSEIGCSASSTTAGTTRESATQPASAPANGPASQPASQPVGPVVEVTGNEATFDLGRVPPASRHVVVFRIHNASDRPLILRRILPDCECVSAENPPDAVPPKGAATVTMIYTAPKKAMEYGSALIVATDDPQRKMITLRVHSLPPGH